MSLRQSLRAFSAALTAAAVLGASFAFAAPPAPAAPAAANAATGKAKFGVMCVACHKKDGTGGFKAAGNPTPNWTLKKTWDATRTDAYLRDCITNGKIKSGMVAWGKSKALTPAQIEDMIAYIHTFKAAAK